MRGGRLEISALALALGLHAAVLGFLRSTIGELVSDPRQQAPSRSEASFEIELDEIPGAETAREDGREIPQASARATVRLVPRAREAEFESVEPETSAFVESPPDVEPPAKPIDLGIGPDGWQRWVAPPKNGEAPRAARPPVRKNRYQVFRPAPVSTTGGLQEGLEEQDRALGLGPQGRILSAMHKAAHTTVAPEAGVARFEVTVHRTGAVEVTLGAASARREQWKKVAAHIASDLRGAPPRIPPPREGFKFVIELVAEQTLPNGSKASSLEKPHLEAPPLKFQSTKDAVEQTNRENPTTENPTADSVALKLDSPGVYLAESGTVCSYRLGVGSIAPGYRLGAAAGPVVQGTCNPSHIGAKPQRMVRARVVEQSAF